MQCARCRQTCRKTCHRVGLYLTRVRVSCRSVGL
jgi:hypothetical protein